MFQLRAKTTIISLSGQAIGRQTERYVVFQRPDRERSREAHLVA